MAVGKMIVDIAIEHANEESEIILLNVVEEIPNLVAIDLPSDFFEKTLQTAYGGLNEIAQSTGRKMHVEARRGESYRTILDVAEEKAADLIIVASHRPGFQDYFLGSTASKVVRHAKCSVLVVR
jgi:nucleotide-binding universal stress UspA family protein